MTRASQPVLPRAGRAEDHRMLVQRQAEARAGSAPPGQDRVVRRGGEQPLGEGEGRAGAAAVAERGQAAPPPPQLERWWRGPLPGCSRSRRRIRMCRTRWRGIRRPLANAHLTVIRTSPAAAIRIGIFSWPGSPFLGWPAAAGTGRGRAGRGGRCRGGGRPRRRSRRRSGPSRFSGSRGRSWRWLARAISRSCLPGLPSARRRRCGGAGASFAGRT